MGVFVPADTPAPVNAKLEKAFAQAIADPQISSRLIAFGGVPLKKSGADFAAFVKEESVKWGNVVKEANVQLD